MIINTDHWRITKSLRKLRLFFSEIFRQGRSMQVRLWIFIFLIASQFIAFIFMVLLSAGVFNFSRNKLDLFLKMQLSHQHQIMVSSQETLTVKGIQMAGSVERQINDWLNRADLELDDLNGKAGLIEELLSSVAPTLRDHVFDEGASGTFLYLNVSNQAAAPGDRAGLLLRNLEPNTVSLTTPNLWLKYGPFEVSKQLGARILPQWRMEFTNEMSELFQLYQMKQAGRGSKIKTYYLSPARSLGAYADRALYFFFPLYDTDGALQGICGFEVNAMIFKLLYTNRTSNYPTSISLIAPQANRNLSVSDGLIAAQTPAIGSKDEDRLLFEESFSDELVYYRGSDGERYVGITADLDLYQDSSPFADERWSFAVILPQRDFLLEETTFRMQILLWTLVAFAISFVLLVLLTLLYMRPIRRTLVQIMNDPNGGEIKRTGILEIDDLLSFLKEKEILQNNSDDWAQSKADTADPDTKLPGEAIKKEEAEAFRQRVASLSPAEKAVFDLYLEGHNAKEITEILYLSINTIKTHNKRIYMKLDVASRRELLEYVYYLEDESLLNQTQEPHI